MTIEQTIRKQLAEHGLWPEASVDAVMVATKESTPDVEERRWAEAASDYPTAFISVLWFAATTQALKWIDANCPQAWYRPMFDKTTTFARKGQ